ncbi:MAG: 4Fe-4S dicluster domain-containing protein [Myxococcota bacterium]
MAELVPLPLPTLLSRMLVEREKKDAIFDLPRRSFFTGLPGRDLSIKLHGQTAATPFGPAAGPHSQLAQNIVLAYLAGGRVMELKTVQILDELKIPRPCIDAATVGFNVEWSQELRVSQSLSEYINAWILIHVLRELGEPMAQSPLIFDLSCGYNLEGIKSEKVTGFIRQMMNARQLIDERLHALTGPLARWSGLQVSPRLANSLTLSTFHGCPANEIESICNYLMDDLGLNLIVKLNPTLLGRDGVRDVVRGQLGYDELRTPDSAFDNDLQWNQALDIIGRLTERAKSRGLTFGVKLTNTLIVHNHKSFFPKTEKEMYTSGEPLHVVALQLLDKLRPHLPPGLPISFSAGVDRENAADMVALGLTPITMCTDLLRPGGYSRLGKYFPIVEKRMADVGANNVREWILNAFGNREEALKRARAIDPNAPEGGDLHVDQAARLNTPHVAKAALTNPRFAAAKNSKPPRKVGSQLRFFDCINCDKCIPVCPNDANFSFETAVREVTAAVYKVEAGKLVREKDEAVRVGKDHQLANFADFCNECGNCDVFCPEDGGPYVVKPRFFGSHHSWKDTPYRDGFHVERKADGTWRVDARIDGVLCALEERGGGARVYHEGPFRIRLNGQDAVLPPENALDDVAPDARLHTNYAQVLCVMLDAVREKDHVSHVSAPFLLPTPA